MKRRNREVSIFSMSALDLFASALGAFILIAIVMFPYFPNTAAQADLDDALERLRAAAGDNDELTQIHDQLNQAIGTLREEFSRCQRQVGVLEGDLGACREENSSQQDRIDEQEAEIGALQDRIDEQEAEVGALREESARCQRQVGALEGDLGACREENSSQQEQIDEQEAENARLRRELDELEFPHLDLVIALDVTGSMGDEIEGLKAEIDGLATILLRLAPSVGVGVVAFGDREWPRPLTQFRLADIGSAANRARVAGFIESLSTDMGMQDPSNPDQPEAILAALRAAVDMPWRSQAELRQVVVVTDNPAYPYEVEATVSAASAFATGAGGGTVSSVFVSTGGSLDGTAAFLARVASAGRGQAVRAGGSMTANLLLSLL